jgi:mannose-1-phosphate guanylyltransferase
MKTIILCGGAGTRLWPVSKQESPKQFAQIFNGESLFQQTIKRNKSLSTSLSVVVNETQTPLCKKQLDPELKTDILVESVARNTAAAIALAAFNADPSEVLLILPSDHLIKDEKLYEESVSEAVKFAQENKLVTFGIRAQYPETGFGYIEADGNEVKSFKEKPDYETACEYIKSGNFFWNSGMFCFKAEVFLNELKVHSPDIYTSAKATYEGSKPNGNLTLFKKELMEKIPSNSIDYAVMEKSDNVSVVPSFFYWSDLGSFDSLYEELETDEDGNTKDSRSINLDSKNNLIVSHKKIIATFDVEDLIIVDTEDAIMIGKRGNSQKVKQLLEKVKKFQK